MSGRTGFLVGVLFWTVLVVAGFPAAAHAEKRVALVIGNGAYKSVPALPNPLNDAQDVAAAFARLGFDVQRVANAGFNDFRKALLEFSGRARDADIAVVFYAGHGIEIGGENYLVPVDAELKTDLDTDNEAINLRTIVTAVSGAADLGLVILDACRVDPFAGKMQRTSQTRAVGRGLAPVEVVGSVLVAFAAADGTTAKDGDGRNSPFSAALLKYLEAPGLEINFLFRNVREEVRAATNNEQRPVVYGSLSKTAIYLAAPTGSGASGAEAGTSAAAEMVWQAIKDSSDPSLFGEYLRRFPVSAHHVEAKSAFDRLKLASSRPRDASLEPKKGPTAVDSTLRADLATDCDRLAASGSDRQRPPAAAGVGIAEIDVRAAVAACDDAMKRYPNIARFAFQAGRVALAAKDYHHARELLEGAAALRSDAAMVDLGLIFEAGKGEQQNYNEARRWYERATDLGNAAAMAYLGALYEHGQGVNLDEAEALRWYQKAAAAGNAQAMNAVGSFYERGRVVPKNYAEARDWYERSARLSDSLAMRNLGALYEHGYGVRRSLPDARKWYESAAAAGDEKAKSLLQALKSK
jgi:uncharacterized caspase-like protein